MSNIQRTDDRALVLKRYMEARSDNLKAMLPANMNPERMKLVAMSAVSRNPDLLKCSPESFMLQLYVAAELGLEAGGVLGHVYLIPRGGEVTGMVGFKGYIELAIREKLCKSIRAECIYQGEEFNYDRGTQEIHHPYSLSVAKSDDSIIGAYAIAELHDGGRAISILDRADLDKRKGCAQTKNVWAKWPKEMSMKSAIRDLFNRGKVSIPTHGRVSQAMQVERDFEEGISPQPESLPVEPQAPKLTGNDGLKAKLRGKREPKPEPENRETQDSLEAALARNPMDMDDCYEIARGALGIAEDADWTQADWMAMTPEQRAKVATRILEVAQP